MAYTYLGITLENKNNEFPMLTIFSNFIENILFGKYYKTISLNEIAVKCVIFYEVFMTTMETSLEK